MKILSTLFSLSALMAGLLPAQAPPAKGLDNRAAVVERRTAFARALASRTTATAPTRPCLPGPLTGLFEIPGGLCEGLAAGPDGHLYLADLASNSIYRVTPQGKGTLFATLCGPTPVGEPGSYWFLDGVKGLGFDSDGNLWACNPNPLSGDPTRHGLWKITPDGGAELAVPLDPATCPFPNGLTFGPKGALYFTESWIGGVWKVEKGQGVATLWAEHELLTSLGGFGPNGIAYKDGALYVANTDQGLLARVPIQPDGSSGTPTLFASGFGWPDGLTVGPDGDFYLIGGTAFYEVIRVDRKGRWEILVGDAAASASLAFASGRGDKPTLFLANFDYGGWTGLPNLLKVELCW